MFLVACLRLKPLSLADGGQIAPYSRAEHRQKTRQNLPYTCGIPLWWINCRWRADFAVPISSAEIKKVAELKYKTPPASIEEQFFVALAGDEVDLSQHQGSLKLCSPAEPLRAILVALQQSILQGSPEEELEKWKQLTLSIKVTLEQHTNDEAIYWRLSELRESLVCSGKTVKETPLGRYSWVMDVKRREEAKKKKRLAAADIFSVMQTNNFKQTHGDCLVVTSVDRITHLIDTFAK